MTGRLTPRKKRRLIGNVGLRQMETRTLCGE
jgi:hypothetical protein